MQKKMVQLRGLLAVLLSVAAELCKDSQCTIGPDQATGEARGLSLMQSGRSVMPGIGQKVSESILTDDHADEFASMEDEVDMEAYTHPHFDKARSKNSSHSVLTNASDPYLYLETFLIVAMLALGPSVFRWVQGSPGPHKTADGPEEAKADAHSVELAPIILGGSTNFSALEKAVRAEDEESCLDLLKQGGRFAVHQEDPCGCTALHVAAHCGSVAMARLLLDQAAKVDSREAWDETPLHIAARSGSTEVCDLLLDRRADIDAANADGWTPMLVAAEARQEDACELLLSRGAGAGGVADSELPPLVNALLFRRIINGGLAPASTEVDSETAENGNEVDAGSFTGFD